MSARRRVRKAQPRGAVSVNKKSPFYRGLAIAHVGSQPNFNLANQAAATSTSSAQVVASNGGLGVKWVSTANAGIKLNTSTLLSSGFSGSTSGISVLVVSAPASSDTRCIAFSAASGSQPEFYLLFNANKGIVPSAGMFAVSTNGANGGEFAGACDGSLKAFVATWKDPSSAPKLYAGGVDGTANASAATGSQLCSGSSFDNVGGYSGTGWAVTGSPILLTLAWNRELSPAEVVEISRNPWQLFSASNAPTFAPPASSASTITSASGASTTSTLTGASTAQATASSAAGASTASTLTGSSTASATATAAAGSSTASTLVGASTASATASSAAGASTASTMAGGSTSALSSFTQADGASTASTMAGGSISEASIIYASGSSSTATMVGAGSVDTMARPGADVLTTGWHASTGTDLFDMIDEASADDTDYIYRDLAGSDPYVFELWLSGVAYSLPAGSHVVRMRADVTAGAAQARLLLLDASDNVVGTGAWQSLTPGLATTTFTVDSAASATKGRIEAVAA